MDPFIIDIRDAEELEELQQNARGLQRRVKLYKERQNPLETLDGVDFKIKYRFTKDTAVFIIDMVKQTLQHDTRGGSIQPHLQVLTAIRTWARGEIQDDSADLSGVSQPQVCRICKQVAFALLTRRREFIQMPHGREQQSVQEKFYAMAGFRQVIGAIDGTHIRIPNMSGDLGQFYVNRKGYSSLNVQVICDAELKIRDIVARWRGSTHDARIFNESVIKSRFESGEFRGRLLGDSGYPCTPYLFTPVLRPTTPKEEAYNSSHIRTRNTVERCFGLWKQRFRCLLKGFNAVTKLENIKMYIVTLAILHNIAILKGDNEIDVMLIGEDNQDIVHEQNNNMRGNIVRAAFIERNF